MLIGRVEIVEGAFRGVRSHVEVQLGCSGRPELFRPIDDPFGSTGTRAVTADIAAADARLLAPCSPRLILGMAHNTGANDRRLPPEAFHKSPHSVIGPGDSIELEAHHDSVDAEAELAVVIGRRARHLTPADALSAVLGFTLVNDVTDRAAQAIDHRWTEAKSRDTYTPVGPWIVTGLDPTDVPITLTDNAECRSSASTVGLARGAVEVLVYLSSVLTLHPGDLVLTGAPGTSVRLRPGATSCVASPLIGELRNPVVSVTR